jgi:hypothetical protein
VCVRARALAVETWEAKCLLCLPKGCRSRKYL